MPQASAEASAQSTPTPFASSPPLPFAPATRVGGETRPVGRRAPHRRRGAATAVAQERPVSAEGKSMVAPGPAAPAPSGHRAAPLSWLSSVPVAVVRLTPPITAVMKGGSQLHCDGLPLMPQHGGQPSLPPPFGGAAINTRHVNS